MPKSRLTRGLRDQIAVELRGDIVSGRFAPGVQMVERQLAQRFGVSHAPIREAHIAIVARGTAGFADQSRRPGGAGFEPAIRRFFMAIRLALESYALRLSFGELDFAASDELLRRLDDARQAGDAQALAELDFDFHQAIVCRPGQADVIAAWRTVVARARVYADEWQIAHQRMAATQADHGLVVQACRARNLDDAIQALENNIRGEMESIPDGSVAAAV